MKRNITILSSLMALAMFFTACEKDNNGLVTLTAEINNYHSNGNTKMNVDANNYTHWTSGDQVSINGTICTVELSEPKAKITGVAQNNAGYTAIYPASIATGANYVNLPAEQTYSDDGNGNQIISAPMAAYTTSNTLTFSNLCALIRVDVTPNTDLIMERIIVTSSNTNLCGSGAIDFGDTPTLGTLDGSKTVTLTFDINTPTTVNSGNTKSFYIYVPQFSNDIINIDVQAYKPVSEGKYEWNKTSSNASISTNSIGIVSNATPTYISKIFFGAGTIDNPYLINHRIDLKNTSNRSSYFKLMKDIDCSEINWTPIAEFTGNFDGNSKTITYTINNTDNANKNLGLFAKATNATIKDLKVSGSIETNCYGGYGSGIGSIAGYNNSSTIQNCYSNVNITSSYSSTSYLNYGGIVGYMNGGSVSYCFVSSNINGNGKNRVGGIIGHHSSGTVTHCTFEGTVSGGTNVGMIVGNTYSENNITNCHYYVVNKDNYNGIKGKGTSSATGEDITGTIRSNKADLTSYVSGITGYYVYTSSIQSRLSSLE